MKLKYDTTIKIHYPTILAEADSLIKALNDCSTNKTAIIHFCNDVYTASLTAVFAPHNDDTDNSVATENDNDLVVDEFQSPALLNMLERGYKHVYQYLMEKTADDSSQPFMHFIETLNTHTRNQLALENQETNDDDDYDNNDDNDDDAVDIITNYTTSAVNRNSAATVSMDARQLPTYAIMSACFTFDTFPYTHEMLQLYNAHDDGQELNRERISELWNILTEKTGTTWLPLLHARREYQDTTLAASANTNATTITEITDGDVDCAHK